MKGIEILSLKDAIPFNPRENTLMIRILPYNSLEAVALEHHNLFRNVFSYKFDDLTPKSAFCGVLFNKDNAREIIEDFAGVVTSLDYLVVHCHSGISRSSAIASSLNHIFNLRVADEDYLLKKKHRPNMYIYNTMINTARELGMQFDFYKKGNVYFPKTTWSEEVREGRLRE
jgi:predicted protein tyrosine phosphatase